ncbi:O-antigen ligase family protein [Bacteroides eggerthii]|nr:MULTISPECIES: O-antigen ligase family protein [Bacteroides]MBV3842683.1 O-antigen ligase family protein [Bacteroides eggerthii]MBV3845602.1 O-antigen ligase family protein [Bacteroides eggerthii]MBV3883780.1 O-antigen ligase family protein [Bacteroides eggerthii]MBV3890727.1 O-antigen ligase family protein [Bacteroides eggerthii]MBV3901888.1 O-antigen ligase family protein [Bacteroides eggerthii]
MKFTPVDYRRQKLSVKKLFLFLLYFDLFLTLLPMWSASPLYLFLSPTALISIWHLGSLVNLIVCGFIILIIQRFIYNKIVVCCILLVYMAFLSSITINGFKSGGFALIGIPISFFIMFDTIKQYKFGVKHLNILFYSLLLWSLLPLLLLCLPALRMSFFMTVEGGYATFSGLALHRNFYGILLCVLLLLLYYKKMPLIIKLILFILLSVCLVLSACRTAFVALIVMTCFLIYYNKTIKGGYKIFFFILVVLLGGVFYWILTNPDYALRDIDDDHAREDLLYGFMKLIKEHPLLGYGEEVKHYSNIYPGGAIAHNFILQTTANYGIFVTVFFIILLLAVYYYSQPFSKAILAFLVIWGITQPYFGFSVFSPHVIIPLFIGNLLDNNITTSLSRF